MSAYVVDDITINRVIAFIKRNAHSLYYSSIPRILQKAGYDVEHDENEWKRLAEDMFWTNCVAVDERYGVGEAKEFRPLDFEYKDIVPPSAIQSLKSLRCWLYQCCEGEVPEKSLVYKSMRDVADIIAYAIVSQMPAYEQAKWG